MVGRAPRFPIREAPDASQTTTDLDLNPPPFSEGLDDWSRSDGTPDSPTYEGMAGARIIGSDPDFGSCLELRQLLPMQRLRYMGEVPIRRGSCLEIIVRLKVLRPPLVRAQIAAWPGTVHGRGIPDLPATGPSAEVSALDEVLTLSTVIGPALAEEWISSGTPVPPMPMSGSTSLARSVAPSASPTCACAT